MSSSGMKMSRIQPWLIFLILCAVGFAEPPRDVFPAEPTGYCSKYSDPFDAFNPERWQEVLLFSKARTTVRVADGSLRLETVPDDPCEAQVYSLFMFRGDFDIQTDYEVVGGDGLKACRFNAGLVFQTPGDELSYKFYIAASGKDHFLFRARRDLLGEQNQETYKAACGAPRGCLRVKREGSRISFLAKDGNDWRKVYAFDGLHEERMRLRFKLQTSDQEEGGKLCPVVVKFDNFIVHTCEAILNE
ncbi:MAG TPA: hypothetical protein DCE18_17910 [Syntrophobacteraceae bacterium]|nr:hypothetical protein [Syntrophobacteraceae bacterium]